MKLRELQAGKLTRVALAVAISAFFAIAEISSGQGSVPAVTSGKLYYENIPQRELFVVAHFIRIESPGDSQVGKSLQLDDWVFEPTLEMPGSQGEHRLWQHDPLKMEWIGAVTAGFVSTAAAITLMIVFGARLDWV